MAFDAERLAQDLGVDPEVVVAAQSQEPNDLAEGVGTRVVNTRLDLRMDEGYGDRLTRSLAADALIGLRETDWSGHWISPEERAEAAVYCLRVLGKLGVKPYGTEEQE